MDSSRIPRQRFYNRRNATNPDGYTAPRGPQHGNGSSSTTQWAISSRLQPTVTSNGATQPGHFIPQHASQLDRPTVRHQQPFYTQPSPHGDDNVYDPDQPSLHAIQSQRQWSSSALYASLPHPYHYAADGSIGRSVLIPDYVTEGFTSSAGGQSSLGDSFDSLDCGVSEFLSNETLSGEIARNIYQGLNMETTPIQLASPEIGGMDVAADHNTAFTGDTIGVSPRLMSTSQMVDLNRFVADANRTVPNLERGLSAGATFHSSSGVGLPLDQRYQPSSTPTSTSQAVDQHLASISETSRFPSRAVSDATSFPADIMTRSSNASDRRRRHSRSTTVARRSDPPESYLTCPICEGDQNCKDPPQFTGDVQNQRNNLGRHKRQKHSREKYVHFRCLVDKDGFPCQKVLETAQNRRRHLEKFHPTVPLPGTDPGRRRPDETVNAILERSFERINR